MEENKENLVNPIEERKEEKRSKENAFSMMC